MVITEDHTIYMNEKPSVLIKRHARTWATISSSDI